MAKSAKIPKSITTGLMQNEKGEVFLPIPKEFCDYLKLKINDEIQCVVKDGELFLTKSEK